MQKANYIVVEAGTKNAVNFYSTELPKALIFAGDCVRHMKSLTGKTYEIVVKPEGGEIISLENFEKALTV